MGVEPAMKNWWAATLTTRPQRETQKPQVDRKVLTGGRPAGERPQMGHRQPTGGSTTASRRSAAQGQVNYFLRTEEFIEVFHYFYYLLDINHHLV